MEKIIGIEKCEHLETEILNMSDTYTGDTCCKACGAVLETGQTVRPKVPEGGKYTAADGTVYNPGDEMPEIVTTGDIYRYGDYEYGYNQYSNGSLVWTTNESQNGWGVDTISNSKSLYASILESINDKPVTNMCRTFYNCISLTTAPDIPINVITMNSTFENCKSLTNSPRIPNRVTNMEYTFYGCALLVDDGLPIIPNSVTNMSYTFYGCNSLVNLSDFVIPNNVTTMFYTFARCTSLIQTPDMSRATSLTDMTYTFVNCSSLVTVTEIPNSVKDMLGTFWDCTSLTKVQNVSSSANILSSTFKNCSSLVDASNLIIPTTGISMLTEMFSGCISLKSAPRIPSNINRMQSTFYNCTSLTGQIYIDAKYPPSSTSWKNCFFGVDFEAQNITLVGSTYIDQIGATGINYCATCNGKCNGTH